MERHLIRRRDAAADRHDRALARDPTRKTAAFRGEVREVIAELEEIVQGSDQKTADRVELSRTLAWTGNAYFDLGAARDEQCLQRSADCYAQAERVLDAVDAPLARAKLDFNYANALRGLSGGTDVPLQEAAEQRYERARRAFSRLGETALARQAAEYLETLRPELSLSRTCPSSQSSGDSGPRSAAIAARKGTRGLTSDLAFDPSTGGDLQPGFRELASLLSLSRRYLLAATARGGGAPLTTLFERFADLEGRVRTGEGSLPALERESWRVARDVHDLARSFHLTMARPVWETRRIRYAPQSVFLSGAPLPTLLEGVASDRGWTLLGEPESDIETVRFNQLRGASVAVFFLPRVQDVEDERGHGVSVWDPRCERAQVCYELGIALTLGIPVVVALAEDVVAPFDVPVETLRLWGTEADSKLLAQAVERAVFSVMWGAAHELFERPVAYEQARSQFALEAKNDERGIAWRKVTRSSEDPFAFAVSLEHFLGISCEEPPELLKPAWPPCAPLDRRCFHATAFRAWSERTKDVIERACQRYGLEYRYGEDSDEQRIVHAVWSELTSASCVIVDLTDLSPNAALELGMAHSLGRPTRVLFQGRPEQLFRSLRHSRIVSYTDETMAQCVNRQIAELAATN